MVGETNGTLYLNNPPGKEGFFETWRMFHQEESDE